MPAGRLIPVLRHLGKLGSADDHLSDRQLLEHFAVQRDEAAFAALVRRHGPAVLGVCRRVLDDVHDADDAFQATFLLLVRKAGSLRQPELLGPWLHGVAYRIALKARAVSARRRLRERPLDDVSMSTASTEKMCPDVRSLLDEAICQLPAKYRLPVVLCYLHGMTNAQAARRLGCPPGTIATRLARARERLRRRLARLGLSVTPAALLRAVDPSVASPQVAGVLLQTTVRTAAVFASAPVAAGIVPARVAFLLNGAWKDMLMDKLKVVLVILIAISAAGPGVLAYRGMAAEPPGRDDVALTGEPPARPGPTPPAIAVPVRQPASPPTATHRSANFVVEASSARLARLVAEAGETERRERAVQWLGKELPTWTELCPIKVKITPGGSGGATSFAFEEGRVLSRDMHLEGPLDRILTSVLPHEITHTIFAQSLGQPVARWADEGGAILSEDEQEQQRHAKMLQTILESPGRTLPLRRLFTLRDFPRDVVVLYAQGYSVTRFLVDRKDRKTFLAFVKQGMAGGWDKAVQSHYGFDTVEDLEDAWLAKVRRDPVQEAAPPALIPPRDTAGGDAPVPPQPAPTTTLPSLPAERAERAGRVVATVNGTTILGEEVYALAYPTLQSTLDLPSSERTRRVQAIWKEALERLIEHELVLQEATVRLQARGNGALENLHKAAAREFDRHGMKGIEEKADVKGEDDLKALLRAQGTSFVLVRRQWERNLIVAEYLRGRIGGRQGTNEDETNQEAAQRLITRLKREATIEYLTER